jgi:hypothetical protein
MSFVPRKPDLGKCNKEAVEIMKHGKPLAVKVSSESMRMTWGANIVTSSSPK